MRLVALLLLLPLAGCGRTPLGAGALGEDGGPSRRGGDSGRTDGGPSPVDAGPHSDAEVDGGATTCGNGALEVNEECDDGNRVDGDGCSPSCELESPSCGDGITDPGEECDDANGLACDRCSPACQLERCGNRNLDCGEECDDGNLSEGDGCSSACAVERATCGDGNVDPGEQCDDGNPAPCDGCTPFCTLERCGNAVLDCREACDDGNRTSGDGCSTSCAIESGSRCGDGIVDPNEQCDDGATVDCDGCSAMCRSEACGNGLTECAEQCDDGNTSSGDGCSSTCTTEADTCGNGVIDAGEACDNGSLNADQAGIEVIQNGISFAAEPVTQFTPATFFYGLVSASAHTGFEARETSNLFLYRDLNTGVLSLFTVHGIDLNTTGIGQPTSEVVFRYTGVPSSAMPVMSDDGGEFISTGPGTVVGDWWFRNNTDGGILEGLPIPGDWTITIQPTFRSGISTFRWVNANGFFTPLAMGPNIVIRAFSTRSTCRTDCTVPFCGDNILDGGEICDDGNNIDGDGCSANCSSVP